MIPGYRFLVVCVAACLSVIVPDAMGEAPEWTTEGQSQDDFFIYEIGHSANKLTKESAYEDAFENAREKIAKSIISRDREFDMQGLELHAGCVYHEFRLGQRCWVKIRFPLVEKRKIEARIKAGADLNGKWREIQTQAADGRLDGIHERIDQLVRDRDQGLYLDFAQTDLLLAKGDAYRLASQSESAYKVYNDILSDSHCGLNGRVSTTQRVLLIGDSLKEKGDLAFAHDYYSEAARHSGTPASVVKEAQVRLQSIPVPNRGWKFRKMFTQGQPAVLCLLRQNGALRHFPALADVLAGDLRDARMACFDLSKLKDKGAGLADQVFSRKVFTPVIDKTTSKPCSYLIAILCDVDAARFGGRWDAMVSAYVYDYTDKKLLYSGSFHERCKDVPEPVLADHVAGVLLYRGLFPVEKPLPALRIPEFKAEPGVTRAEAKMMKDMTVTQVDALKRFQILSDSDSLEYRVAMPANKQDALNYLAYGEPANSYSLGVAVSRLGTQFMITATLADLERAENTQNASLGFSCLQSPCFENGMKDFVRDLLKLEQVKRGGLLSALTGAGRCPHAVGDAVYPGLSPDLKKSPGAYVSLTGLATGSDNAQACQKTVADGMKVPVEVATRKSEIVLRLIPPGTLLTAEGKGLGIFPNCSYAYAGKYEISQKQWKHVMSSTVNPSTFKGDDKPVESVTPEEAQEFCDRLCVLEDVPPGTYRLLVEQEWEYITRGGAMTPYYRGEDAKVLDRMAWFDDARSSQPVGQKSPNAWGIYDAIGNVWEWTLGAEGSGAKFRARGGGWNSTAQECLVTFLPPETPARANVIGFRVIRLVTKDESTRLLGRKEL